MADIQHTSQQETQDVMLSPDAKEFVPRGLSSLCLPEDETVSTVNKLPSYITTCYPFVSSEPRVADRGYNGKQPVQHKFYHLPQYFPILTGTGIPQNRFPHPVKNAWNQVPFGEMYQQMTGVANGIPFDGGTYQNGFINQPVQQHVSYLDENSLISPPTKFSTSSFANTAHLFNGFSDHLKHQTCTNYTKRLNGFHDSSRLAEYSIADEEVGTGQTNAKAFMKNSMVQTDFQPEIADATLEEKPNSFFKKSSSKSRWKSSKHQNHGASEIDLEVNDNLDNEYKNKSGRKNSISNDANLLANLATENGLTVSSQDQMTTCSGQQVARTNKDRTTSLGSQEMDSILYSVPYTENTNANNTKCAQKQSYASIAKPQPSQMYQNLVSTTTKNELNICDISNNGRYYRNNTRIGNVTVNVVQIMTDLENAESLIRVANGRLPKVQNSDACLADRNLPDVGIYSNGCTVKIPADLSSKVFKKNEVMTINQGHSFICHGDQQEQNGFDHDNDQCHNLIVPSSDNANEIPGKVTEVRHKKRRKRHRKKKAVTAMQDDKNDEANYDDNVTFHFEDEEEFPDLLTGQLTQGAKNISSLSTLAMVSYSEVLKQSDDLVQSLKSAQDGPSLPANNSVIQSCSQSKESRTSRKRRKRREVANKAAEAEMAEISLEQHMLELKMKQKLPLNAKKSLSPVRTAQAQAVWKLNQLSSTSQPTVSGKKVSLLLPGDVPPEPPVPHQPNSEVKQPGILKIPSVSAPVNTGTGGSKKSQEPSSYDIGALIDEALKAKKEQTQAIKETKPIVIKKEDLKPLNFLDSSAPTVKRGKERETPKIKKPSPLKKVILKEREEKKRLRLLDNEDEDMSASIEPIIPVSIFPSSPISTPVGIGVVSGGESDLSQDASFRNSLEVGLGTPASAELSPISQPSPSCMSPMSSGTSPLNSGVNSPVTGTHVIQQTVKLKIHSRRFREYCNQLLDKEVDNYVTALLTDLVRFQDKQYHKDPVKAKAKRRFVLGLREVTKHLKLRKVKCVIISPNLEKIQSKGGLDDALNTILELCNEQQVPFIFSLGRRALGRACAKLVPVSVVGIFNYEGSEENFKSVVRLTEKAREQYREMISQIEKEIAEQPSRSSASGMPQLYAHYGHSRTPSGCSVISFTSSILSEPISENYPQSEPETDNRGYEIEDKVDADVSADIKDEDQQYVVETDPYEADDESGFDTEKKSPRSQQKDIFNNSVKNEEESIEMPKVKESSPEILSKNIVNTEVILTQVKDLDPGDLSQELSDDDDLKEAITDINVDIGITDIMESDSDNLHFVTCNEESDSDHSNEGDDKVYELPNRYNSSGHCFDHTEVLSQHSQHTIKTVDNCEEVMSTHSSKTTHSYGTCGDGSNKAGERCSKSLNEVKNIEPALPVKIIVDLGKEHRTLTWVDAQIRHTIDWQETLVDCE